MSRAPISAATTEVARELIEDQRPWRKVINATVGIDALDWRLGEIVNLTHPRYGLALGKNCALMGKRPNFFAGEVGLILLTQITPDFTTGAVN